MENTNKNSTPFIVNVINKIKGNEDLIYHKDYSARGFFRILSIILMLIIIFNCISQGKYYSDVVNKNNNYSKYVRNYAYSEDLSEYRQELNEKEIKLDYDSDGITNEEEIALKYNMYSNDTNYNGVGDYSEKKANVQSGSVRDYFFDNAKADNAKQVARVISAKSVEFNNKSDNKIVAMQYTGNAFDGLKYNVFNPFVIYGYSGSLTIKSSKLKEDDQIYVLKYNPNEDTYSQYSAYVYAEKSTGSITIDVGKGTPIYIYKKKKEYNENRSLDAAVLSNIYSDNMDVATTVNGSTYQITFFDKDILMNKSYSQEILERFGKKGDVVVDYRCNASRDNFAEYVKYVKNSNKGVATDDINIFKKIRYDFLNSSKDDYKVKYDDVKAESVLNKIQKRINNDGKKIVKVATKSKGYSEVYDSKFRPSENGFSFNNMVTEQCPDGLNFAMAEVASNYYNYSKTPKIENDTNGINNIVNYQFHNEGINSDAFIQEQINKDGIKTATISNSEVITLLEQKSLQNKLNYFNKKDKYNYSTSVLSAVAEKLKSGKTVVAYMKKGNKAIAVVVYAMKISAYDPNEYVLNVYDPNFPNGTIRYVKDEESGEEKIIKANMNIYIHAEPYAKYDDKSKKIICTRKFTFDYGNSIDYSFGNSRAVKHGTVYTGGDICFKRTDDYSKTIDNFSFIS